MTTPGYSRAEASSAGNREPAAIMSVDTTTRMAVAMLRTRYTVNVNCGYAVGDAIVTPAFGEQWYVERFDGEWRLVSRIPFNDPTLNIEAEPGQVSVGSASGPLELNGTDVRVHTNLQLNDTHYRDVGGELQKQQADGSWIPVIPMSGSFVLSTDITDSTSIGRTILTAIDALAVRTASGAGTYSKPGPGIPKTDLTASLQTSIDSADSALQTVASDDITDSTALGQALITITDAAAARAAIGVGTGITVASTDITDATTVGRNVLTAATQAAARTAIGATSAVASTDITDSTALGRTLVTIADAAAARSAIGAVGTTDAQTLTEKRITERVDTITSSATPTINTDDVDVFGITALAVPVTSFTVTGTPTDGQKLWVYIVGTATRTIAWGSSFENGAAALPVTTIGTQRLDVGFIWNASTNKWRCMASGPVV